MSNLHLMHGSISFFSFLLRFHLCSGAMSDKVLRKKVDLAVKAVAAVEAAVKTKPAAPAAVGKRKKAEVAAERRKPGGRGPFRPVAMELEIKAEKERGDVFAILLEVAERAKEVAEREKAKKEQEMLKFRGLLLEV